MDTRTNTQVTDSTWLPRPDNRCSDFREATLRAATAYLSAQGGA